MTSPDTPARYGTVTRFLHWGIALCLAWMFGTAITHVLAEKSALDAFFWPTHKHFGSLLMVLVSVRVIWALLNARQRPPALNPLARLGHLAMYGLMVAIPLIGLLRQFGSGRAFAPLGLPLFAGFDEGEKIGWMVDLGGLLHGELGWALLALVCGHIAMALWHRRSPRYDVMPRMAG